MLPTWPSPSPPPPPPPGFNQVVAWHQDWRTYLSCIGITISGENASKYLKCLYLEVESFSQSDCFFFAQNPYWARKWEMVFTGFTNLHWACRTMVHCIHTDLIKWKPVVVHNLPNRTRITMKHVRLWLRFYSSLLIYISSLSISHNNVASVQKNRAINRTVQS